MWSRPLSKRSTHEFAVERAASLVGPFGQIATRGAGATSYSDASLAASTTYYFRVRAYNGAGYSGYSNIAGAKTPKN